MKPLGADNGSGSRSTLGRDGSWYVGGMLELKKWDWWGLYVISKWGETGGTGAEGLESGARIVATWFRGVCEVKYGGCAVPSRD
jgi:hypothetical protein